MAKKRIHELIKPYVITKGNKFRLKDFDPGDTGGFTPEKDVAQAALARGVKMLRELQEKLYAQNNFSKRLIRRPSRTLPARAARSRDLLATFMPESFTPTVFVVDDDPSVRTAVKRLLASVGLPCETFSTAAEFLARSEGGVSGCLVLDVRMPGASGLDLQRMLNHAGTDLPIIFVTAHADVPLTVRAMKAGALEVLTKPFDDQALLDAVYQALEQERVRSHDREELQRLRDRFETLTAREREVMGLVVTGMLNKQVAGELGTAEKTIKVHRAQVMHKMQADSVAELVRMADRLNLGPRAS
jgi:FixJ family two-component response regulator